MSDDAHPASIGGPLLMILAIRLALSPETLEIGADVPHSVSFVRLGGRVARSVERPCFRIPEGVVAVLARRVAISPRSPRG